MMDMDEWYSIVYKMKIWPPFDVGHWLVVKLFCSVPMRDDA